MHVNTEAFFTLKKTPNKKDNLKSTCNILQFRKAFNFQLNILIVANQQELISLKRCKLI